MTTKTEDKTPAASADDADSSANFQKGRPLLPRASNTNVHAAARGKNVDAEDKRPKPGMPEGYKPDTSFTYVKGKEGKDGDAGEDQIKGPDGKTSAVSPDNKNTANAMETLPEGHTYRDRVEAQARSLGVEVVPEETLELLMWKIRMQASS